MGGNEQAGRDREAGGAEPERDRIDVRDVDAGELGAAFSLATARMALPVRSIA